MKQLQCYGDSRNKGFCVHCGGPDETRDHVPAKVLLDEPYPENLPVCPSCLKCNNASSIDEEYVSCLLECVIAGEADIAKLRRSKVARLLGEKPLLLERLRQCRSVIDGVPVWNAEAERVKTVIVKLARGHAAYELNEPKTVDPRYIRFIPLATMTQAEREEYEGFGSGVVAPCPEVGSRALQRLLIAGADVYAEGWVVVQEGNYRFRTSQEDGLIVQMVLREYLACQVGWD
jgi:hypothetical protein